MAKMPFNFNLDLKKLSKESLKSVDQLSKQFVAYEKRVKNLVHEMDVSTRDARKQGRDRLDRFLEDLRDRRDALEQKVTELVALEGKRINEGVNELVTYLKQLRATGAASGAPQKSAAKSAKPSASAKAPAVKTAASKAPAKKASAGAKKASAPSKPRRKASTTEASPSTSL